MRKTSKLMVPILALTVLLSACGGGNGGANSDAKNGGDTLNEITDSKSPTTLELPDVTGLATAEATGNGAKYSYPADKWTLDEANGQLFYNDTLESDSKVNATVKFEAANTKLTDDDLADLKASFSSDMSFLEAKHAEFVSVNGSKAAYLDIVITDLEAYVDMIIEQSGLSEADLEAYGGRDGLLERIPPTNQLMFYFNVDGDLYSMSGVYFNDVQRNDLMELFATALPTTVKD